MLTPVVKLFPGAQPSPQGQSPGATLEKGPEGARAALIAQPDALRRRHGESRPEIRMPLVTEGYRAAGPRPAAAPARRRDQQRVEGLVEALARLEALEAGLAEAALIVIAAGPGAEAIRLDDAPLRPPPEPGLGGVARLFGMDGAAPDRRLGAAGPEARVTLHPDASVVLRPAERQAGALAAVGLARPAPGRIALDFAGGGRIAIDAPLGGTATLLLADGARLALDPAEDGGFDLRL